MTRTLTPPLTRQFPVNKIPPPLPSNYAPIADAVSPAYDRHTRELLDSYSRDGGLNTDTAHNLPSKRAVAKICEDLLQLIFPGYHDDGAVAPVFLGEMTAARLRRVATALADQVRKGVRVGDPHTPTGKTPPIITAFFDGLPEVRRLLRTDIEAAYEGDPSATSREEILLSFPFIEAIAIQRLAHLLYKAGAPLIPRLMTEWAHSRTGIDIHPGASIGAHFFIDHGTGTVIGETVLIGDRVKIYHGVTLGARSFVKNEDGEIEKGGKRHPDVESGVTIYPNATILGGATVIGRDSTIGANVFLLRGVPANSLVVYEEKQLAIRDKALAPRHNASLDWTI